MTNYFVDSSTGSDSDNGTTMDLAWATLDHAVEVGTLNPGDIIWVRRIHSETPTSDIAPADSGTGENPIQVIGWPRPVITNTTITQADFTNGSRIIDNIIGITPSRTSHIGRYITAPDGKQYLLTAVIWESSVDGMGAGDEFTIGEEASNTTQTKNGKIWGFTDNLDETGTIQYVRDSASSWVDNDNITDSGGGNAEIDSGGETAVGFLLDREYVGSTVTGTNGKFQIEADEDWNDDMGTAFGFDDSGWTIKESNWDSDAIDLPLIDFDDGNYNFYPYYGDYSWVIKNLELKDSSDSYGPISMSAGGTSAIIGCLIKQTTTNTACMGGSSGKILIKRCIVEGVGTGSSQLGLVCGDGVNIILIDCSIYNCGDYGIRGYRGINVYLDNVDIGIAIGNGDTDIGIGTSSSTGIGYFYGKDISLGGVNGEIYTPSNSYISANLSLRIENYNKVLGSHKSWYPGGTFQKSAISGETPNKKVSDYVIKISPNESGFRYNPDFDLWCAEIFCHEFEATTDSLSYKYWLYNDTGSELNDSGADIGSKADIWLEAEYVNSYDDTSEYTMTKIISSETDIADAADADDWDYLSIASINPAVASKVRIKCFCRAYVASGDIFIDPAVVIS